MICILCDFCGKELDKYEITDDFELMKYKSRGRICCEDCEKRWEAYEHEVREIQENFGEKLEEAVSRIKEKYFKDYGSSLPKAQTAKLEGDKTTLPKGKGYSHFKLR